MDGLKLLADAEEAWLCVAADGDRLVVRGPRRADWASDTMVHRMTALANSSGGKPLAMVIGAAHTERVTQLLREANVSFAVVRPDPLLPEYGQMPFAQFERKHHLQ